ncbi:MAG: anaerobic ribonucleoside-triphosphate reductase activating protein [Candidatus Paceibacterota bacterium]|jgi:pyruvate formate lyase activating enzyme
MAIIIGGLQKVTLVDYPAKVACTVFLSGCNFRCPFCYSQELVLPEFIKNHPQINEEQFFSFLKERKGLIDGCVVCGGEPTINPELPKFLKKIKELGFAVKLDTNGSNPEMLKKIINEKLVDYIAMDIKAPLREDKYSQVNGASLSIKKIKDSIDLIKNSGIDYEFRSTIVPGLHSKEDIIEMANDITPAEKYFLQQFRNEKETIDLALNKINPNYPDDFLSQVEKEIAPLFKIFKIR